MVRGTPPSKRRAIVLAASSESANEPPPQRDPMEIRNEKLASMSIIDERAMQFDRNTPSGAHFLHTITALGWEHFIGHSEDAWDALVREFYFTIPEATNGSVLLRRKWVRFSPEAINAFYGLENYSVQDDDYRQFLLRSIPFDMIRDVLTLNNGAEFVSKSKTVLNTNFSKESKTWRIFIAHRIFPSSHHREVTKEHYILLFNILLHHRINIGRLIYDKIMDVANALRDPSTPARNMGLGFPCLITGLCLKAGIPIPAIVQRRRMKAPIDENTFPWPQWQVGDLRDTAFSYYARVWHGRSPFDPVPTRHHVATPQLELTPAPTAEPGAYQGASSSSAQPDLDIASEIRRLHHRLDEHDDRYNQQLQNFEARQQSFYRDFEARQQALLRQQFYQFGLVQNRNRELQDEWQLELHTGSSYQPPPPPQYLTPPYDGHQDDEASQ